MILKFENLKAMINYCILTLILSELLDLNLIYKIFTVFTKIFNSFS